jgi:hypothetical protein
MVKLCPYDKLPCNPGCLLYEAENKSGMKNEEGRLMDHVAYCRKFGVV